MLSEGATAPSVSLPGYVDGERERVDLGEYLGEGIVVLAFYPADFGPACTARESDLDGLDLFTMQKDVAAFAISPDSTYSHAAFAERYGLRIPLLSDADGEAAAAYGVARETAVGESLPRRAVFVVDHHGTVQYAWATGDLEEGVDVDPVTRAVEAVTDDELALERYRAGRDRYVAARGAFEAAMAEYEDREWVAACAGFREAEAEFAAATDRFDTAVRFAGTATLEAVADRAEERADTLGRAADWLGESADALGNGRGKQGTEYRADAEGLLATADGLPDPPDPDALSLTDEGVELDESVDPVGDRAAVRGDDVPALDVDTEALDAADIESESEGERAGDEDPAGHGVEGDAVQGDLELDLDVTEGNDRDRGVADGSEQDVADDRSAIGGTPARPDDVAPADDTGGDATDSATGGSDGDGETGEDEVIEELDLVDPTEDDDGDDDQDDWDISGQ